MIYIVKKVTDVTYRVKNEMTNNLPTQFTDIHLEFNREPTYWMIQNEVGLYIMNTTGHTPEYFVVDEFIPYGVEL